MATSSPTYDLKSLSAYQRLLWSVEMPRREAVRVDLLTHDFFPPFFRRPRPGWTASVMWLVRLLMRVGPALGAGRQRFIVGPRRPGRRRRRGHRAGPSVVSALAMALSSTL